MCSIKGERSRRFACFMIKEHPICEAVHFMETFVILWETSHHKARSSFSASLNPNCGALPDTEIVSRRALQEPLSSFFSLFLLHHHHYCIAEREGEGESERDSGQRGGLVVVGTRDSGGAVAAAMAGAGQGEIGGQGGRGKVMPC